MKWLVPIFFCITISTAFASDDGLSIYLHGTDSGGLAIKAVINDLESGSPLACVNCHRESGLGTSESGKTIPPVNWRFLSEAQPADNSSRFYTIQNKRPAYNTALVHRILTMGINSKGEKVDTLMPRYDLTEQQTRMLVEYLKTLYPHNDPGVSDETIKIATIIDARLPYAEKQQHREFVQGLFKMKNSETRGELKRKKYPPIQKAPQYQSYRKWELLIWELPENTELWAQALNQYYRDQPVFVVLSPLIKDNYSHIGEFCFTHNTPCLFSHSSGGTNGDYYNFVFRDSEKQQRDYIAYKFRSEKNELFYLDREGVIDNIRRDQIVIPKINKTTLATLKIQFKNFCAKDSTLILIADNVTAPQLYEMNCPEEQKIKIKLLSDSSLDYQNILEIMNNHSNPNICWVTDYSKVLKRNTRKIRVDILARKLGIKQVRDESLAKDLFAFGLLTDSMHQLAGNFSRSYLLENIEHMLNSYPNYTYFSSVSGAPNQRAIVGSYKEYCPDKDRV